MWKLLFALLFFSCKKNIDRPALNCSIISLHHNICTGSNSAYAVIKSTGGTRPYLYQLDDNRWQKSDTLLHIPSGSHHAFVKDAWNNIASVSFPVVGSSMPCTQSYENQ